MIFHKIPRIKITTVITSVITENTLFFLFCLFPANPAIAKITDNTINPNTNQSPIPISLESNESVHPTMINVIAKHNKLSNPNLDVFVSFSLSKIPLIHHT